MRGSLRSMLRRLPHVLLALVIALATTLPAGASAIPAMAGMTGTGMQQHCPGCLHEPLGGTNPDKMLACPILACAGAVAMLAAPALPYQRVLLRTAYPAALPLHWVAEPSAPDPFPPRPIVLL